MCRPILFCCKVITFQDFHILKCIGSLVHLCIRLNHPAFRKVGGWQQAHGSSETIVTVTSCSTAVVRVFPGKIKALKTPPLQPLTKLWKQLTDSEEWVRDNHSLLTWRMHCKSAKSDMVLSSTHSNWCPKTQETKKH
jgi:hypothetical protein